MVNDLPDRMRQRLLANQTRRGHRPYYTPDQQGCWIWQGYTGRNWGYGWVAWWDGDRQIGMNAHRAMYVAHKGPLDDDLSVDHLCRVTNCVNPEHMEPVTQAENMRRGALARSYLNPERVSTAMTKEQISEQARAKYAAKVGRPVRTYRRAS